MKEKGNKKLGGTLASKLGANLPTQQSAELRSTIFFALSLSENLCLQYLRSPGIESVGEGHSKTTGVHLLATKHLASLHT